MYDVFDEMNTFTKENWRKIPKEKRWDIYESYDKVNDLLEKAYVLKDGIEQYDTYSALAMRFLEPEDRILFSFYTEYGDTFTLRAATQLDKENAWNLTQEYFEAVNSVYNALDNRIERKPIQLYKGSTSTPEWTAKNKPSENVTLADLASRWKPGENITFSIELQNSFSEHRAIANRFIREKEEGTPIIFKIVTNRGAPISSVSAKSIESEHLMRPGEIYRLLHVSKNTSFTNRPGYDYVIEYANDVDKVDYEFSL
jgi:hypothetical protein